MAFVTLQFVTGRGFESSLIRYYTRSEISHVDLVVTKEVAERMNWTNLYRKFPGSDLLESDQIVALLGSRMKGGVQFRRPGYDHFRKIIRADFEIPNGKYYSFWKIAEDQVGKSYDTKSIVAFAIPRIHRQWSDTNQWFCSEYAYYCFWSNGIFPQMVGVEAARIDPRDLLISPMRQNVRIIL